MTDAAQEWYAVRCIFRFPGEDPGSSAYEERITLWHAADADDAIARAEDDALAYAAGTTAVPGEYLGLAQAYWLIDTPGDGAEVFSLVRESPLTPDEYVTTYFDDGLDGDPEDD